MAELTPMRRQYLEMKARHPDCILFFRLGDFYEMFDQDALLVSRELDLTLTTRDRNKPEEERTPMCGVPFHSYEGYLARLIAKGYKVAICEQTEDPAQAKGLVERGIIRVVTPGTVVDAAMLEEGRNNFLCAVYQDENGVGLCICDVSTGETSLTGFRGEDALSSLCSELGRCSPREALLSPEAMACGELTDFLKNRLSCRCEAGGEARFEPEAAREKAEAQFGAGALSPATPEAVRALGALLGYLYETQMTDLSYLRSLQIAPAGRYMELDYGVRRSLELTATMRGGEKHGSLLGVLDRTKTPMGRRTIRSWIERPLLDVVAIRRRLDAVEALVRDSVSRDELALVLRGVSDLERLIGKTVYGSVNGRDLVALSAGLAHTPALLAQLSRMQDPPALLRDLAARLDPLEDLRAAVDSTLVDEPPLTVREGEMIRPGVNEELDSLRSLRDGGKDTLAAIEASEREKTGIRTLKVRYNKVFGYYIEVPRAYDDQVPEHYIRKQTLVNCERYITQELKELEQSILTAGERIQALEYQLFTALRTEVAAQVGRVQSTSLAIARLDVLTALAAVAADNRYCKPEVDLSDRLDIINGRHPVVEHMLSDSLFVPNDTHMDCGANRLAIVTGPNMAGKSTYMRQVALIVLMAQMGSFVPASDARIGVADRIFTRIGASDDLAAGQSTFMVEMTEVAELLRRATGRSLLILDELGRGTSTYDGMSIARAVLEYCCDKRKLGARTLFATHYHELSALEGELEGVKNYSIAVKKKGDTILFLRKILPGATDRSYGVEVAQLAGVPTPVVNRAKVLLRELEARRPAEAPAPAPVSDQLSLADQREAAVLTRLRKTQPELLTPLEALNLICELQRQLEE